ncbi:MAG TPA: hypothetical protein VGI43_11600 [Mucilaginibacter sp.]
MIKKNYFKAATLYVSFLFISLQVQAMNIKTRSKESMNAILHAKIESLRFLVPGFGAITSNRVSLIKNSKSKTSNPQLISGAVSPAKQSIQYNTAPASIISSVAAGGNGTYAYQWQMSIDRAIWANISGATSLIYSPGNLKVTTYYRVVSSSSGASVSSNIAVVNLL